MYCTTYNVCVRCVGQVLRSQALLQNNFCFTNTVLSTGQHLVRVICTETIVSFFPQDILQVFPDCLCFFRKFIFDRKYFRETAIFGMLRAIFFPSTSTESLKYICTPKLAFLKAHRNVLKISRSWMFRLFIEKVLPALKNP